MEYNENLAIELCEKSAGKEYIYKGEKQSLHGKVGTFSILYDCNCCCPTDQILFAFQSEDSQYPMSAQDFLTFYHASVEKE